MAQPYKGKKKKELKDMTTSEKKQSFFRWLLKRGVDKNKAALITHRKFFHGDPFEQS